MLKRVRIEVEEESAAGVMAALDKYEHALQATEDERFGLDDRRDGGVVNFANWGSSVNERTFFNEQLGREVTDEVIEFCPNDVAVAVISEDGNSASYEPGWRGRRVVVYRDIQHRDLPSVVPAPWVVDHWEDRTPYPEPQTSGGAVGDSPTVDVKLTVLDEDDGTEKVLPPVDAPNCVCGQVYVGEGAVKVEIGGVVHRLDGPCFHMMGQTEGTQTH